MSQASFSKSNLYDSAESRVGVTLRDARTQQGYSVEQIAEQLCIRAVHLKAIEDGNYDDLPALVYARGFVRSYAEFLRMDHDSILEQFRRETAGREQILDPVYIPSNSNRQLPSRRVIFGSLAGLALLIVLWSFWSSPSAVDDSSDGAEVIGSVDMPAEDGMGLTTPADMQKNVYPPADGKRADNAVKPIVPPVAPQTPVQNVPQPVPVAPDAPSAVISPQNIAPVAEAPAQQAQPQQSPAPAANQTQITASGIAFEALSDSWIEITNYDDKPLYTRVLRKGEIYNLPINLRGQYLTTGNAGGLMLRVNGERAGVLGNQGEVVHDIILDNRNLSRRARELPR